MTGHERKTILVIEDEEPIILFATKSLEMEGYQVLQALNADDGMKTLDETRVDLVLLDLMLPGKMGWSVLEKMKGTPSLLNIPVVVFSAAVEVANQERAKNLGATTFLMKPLDADTLQETVDSILKTGE